MRSLWLLLGVCVWVHIGLVCTNEDFVQEEDRVNYARFRLGTKTPYFGEEFAGRNTAPPESCEPVHAELIVRHGSRMPGRKDIEDIIKVEKEMEKVANLAKDGYRLSGWESPLTESDIFHQLLPLGKYEMRSLAERLHKRFNSLFSNETGIYRIQSTAVNRTRESALYFIQYLFKLEDLDLKKLIHEKSLDTDHHLRFFDLCSVFVKNSTENKSFLKALKGKYLSRIASRLSNRVLKEGNFSTETVSALWSSCVFEIVLNLLDKNLSKVRSCSLFSKEDVDQLEWVSDMLLYNKLGYGQRINSQMSCILFEDIVRSLNEFIANGQTVANLRFAHAETLVPLITHLGLYNDKEGTMQDPRDPESIPKHREWRSSKISPFAANLLFVLYRCTNREDGQYFIKLLHNEEEVTIPGCSNQLYCPYNTFLSLQSKCHFNSTCDIQTPRQRPSGVGSDASDSDDDGFGGRGFFAALTLTGVVVTLMILYCFFFQKRQGLSSKEKRI